MSEAVIDGPSNLAGHVLLSGLCGLVATYQGSGRVSSGSGGSSVLTTSMQPELHSTQKGPCSPMSEASA